MKYPLLALLVVFAVQNILDGVSTYKAIGRGAAEANPVVRFIITV